MLNSFTGHIYQRCHRAYELYEEEFEHFFRRCMQERLKNKHPLPRYDYENHGGCAHASKMAMGTIRKYKFDIRSQLALSAIIMYILRGTPKLKTYSAARWFLSHRASLDREMERDGEKPSLNGSPWPEFQTNHLSRTVV